jgi:hypothetical protein
VTRTLDWLAVFGFVVVFYGVFGAILLVCVAVSHAL